MQKITDFFKNHLKNTVFSYCVIFVVIFLFCFKALFFGYTWLDDIDLLFFKIGELRNLDLQSLLFKDFFLLGGKSSLFFYRPLALFPWVVAARIFDVSPSVYHFENIFFHITACMSLFALLERLGNSRKNSLMAVLIFSFGAAAAAIAGFMPNLSYPMLLTFLNLSFLSGIAFLKTKSKKQLFGHIFFFTLGLFTLETAIGFVPVFLFYLVFVFFRNEDGGFWRFNTERWKYAGLLCSLYIVPFLAWFIMRRIAIGGGIPQDVFHVILSNIPSLFAPIVNFFLPFMARPLARSSYDAPIIFGIILAAILVLLPVFRRKFIRNLNVYLLGAVIYLCFLLPSSLSGFEFNDMPHRGYIPSVGLVIMLLQINWKALVPNRIRYAIVIAFMLFSAVFSYRLCSYYSDGEVFWNKVLSDNPGYMSAYMQLMNVYRHSGNYEKAIDTERKSLSIDPNDYMVRSMLASDLANAGYNEEAEKEYKEVLANVPDNVSYLVAYGEFLNYVGRINEAGNVFAKAIVMDPNYQQGHFAYANYFLAQEKWADAEREYRAALSSRREMLVVNMDENDCRRKLAYTILKQAEAEDDVKMAKMAEEAVGIADFPEVYEHAAYMLLNRRFYDAAMKMFAIALQTDPGRLSSAIGAAVSAAKNGDFENSKNYSLTALKIDPENAKAREIMETITPYLKR